MSAATVTTPIDNQINSEMVSSMAKVEEELCKNLGKRIEEQILAVKDWGRLGTGQVFDRVKFLKNCNAMRAANGLPKLSDDHIFTFEEDKYANIPGEMSYKLVNEITLPSEAEAFLTKVSQGNKQLYAINRYNMLDLIKGSLEKSIENHNVFKKYHL